MRKLIIRNSFIPGSLLIFRWVAAYAFLNAPFWWWGRHYFLNRPLFNVELVLPVILATVYAPFAYFFLVGSWFIDAIVSQSATFYFTSPLDFFRSIPHAFHISWREYISWEKITLLLPFVATMLALPRLIPQHLGGRWIAVLIPLLLAIADVANGSSMASTRAVRFMDINIAGSPIFTLGIREFREKKQLPLKKITSRESSRNLIDINAWAKLHPSHSAILIVVESWGISSSVALREWLRNQFWSPALANRYRNWSGSVPFHGSTTNGELRELCGVAGSYRKVLNEVNPLHCLPHNLQDLGWISTGLHGFSQNMFRRLDWWPKLGLQHMQFAEQMLSGVSPLCGGAFAGACDSQLLDDAFEIARKPRQFVYVLTLNSHLPIKAEQLPEDLKKLCAVEQLETADCQLNAVLGKMLRAVRRNLLHVPSHEEPLVVMVGDHAPPFADTKIRQHYSQTEVQAYALVPLE